MLFGLLGEIRIGESAWTGPTASKDGRKATFAEHKVARGKPVLQDMGDELDTRELTFFFDETFCQPQAELAKLRSAFTARMPLAYVSGGGATDGIRFIVEDFDVATLKCTPAGRPVRIKVTAKLKEVPIPSPLTFLGQVAIGAALALGPSASLNVGAQIDAGGVSLSAEVSVGIG